ncbi:MAG: CHAT domain-containing protein, partial [Pseudomonadota bacterium]|nr:CHAT domain-containing protein [Pseudomonadota bacterium]
LAEPGSAYAAAVSAAEGTAPDLALWGRLAGAAPLQAGADAAPALLAEQSVRGWLATGTGGLLSADLAHPGVTGWNALSSKTTAPADAPGVAAWARVRAALDAGDAAAAGKELGTLSTVVPAWRTGPWAPLTRLDGPRPEDLDADAVRNARAADPLPFAVAHHGWAARVRSTEELWARGIAPLPAAATADQRAAVWDAAAAHRLGLLAWVAGRDAYPAAAATALDAAEKAAGLTRYASPSLTALRSTLDGDALLSFRTVPTGIEALYVGEQKGKVGVLPASLGTDTARMFASLRVGGSAVADGDRIRATVIDGAMDVLLGVGRYIVVGPPPVGLLPVAALPEQADGLRFLASIRHVGYLPDFDALLPPAAPVEPEIGSTMFALCADDVEALAVRRVYPDAKVLQGAAATVASFRENAGAARFLHVGSFPVTPDGGFQLADGTLTLGDIAALPLGARGVLIGGAAPGAAGLPADLIAGRMAAFRHAGAQDVLVEAWSTESELRSAILLHFWEGLNRRYSASRSLSEARTLALRELGDDEGRLPSSWGGYFVSGRP